MDKFTKQFFYLLFGLPLGIFYFVTIVTGFLLGIGLFVTWVGMPIMLGVFGFSGLFSKYERSLANNFLDANIPPLSKIEAPHGVWPGFKARFLDQRTWMRAFYLVMKLPWGIFTFTVEVTFFFVSLFLVLTPFLYQQFWYRYIGIGFWHVSSLPLALAASGVGVLLAIAFYYVTKGLALVSRELVRSALGD